MLKNICSINWFMPALVWTITSHCEINNHCFYLPWRHMEDMCTRDWLAHANLKACSCSGGYFLYLWSAILVTFQNELCIHPCNLLWVCLLLHQTIPNIPYKSGENLFHCFFHNIAISKQRLYFIWKPHFLYIVDKLDFRSEIN